jgi:ParB family transcriptional regulator, chromosome partitioning protein
MAKAVQKIKLSPSCDIPFNKLVLSQSNVRRIKAGISIEDLAEDIAHRGKLLQSLYVRPVLDAEGQDTGMFEVPAGGRRYRALEFLVKQKRLPKTAPIPCIVGEASNEISAEEDSLAENVHRVALHPLDQFRAFQTLREQRKSEEEIAAIFFVSVNVVKQRLRLAAVSPKLLDVYADDGMSLEQLMAFSVTDDHARQEQVWENVNKSGYDEPYQIRRVLTERAVQASDKRARFVGVAAYEAAGGNVLRDLFEEDGGGWLEDIALLERLVAEKLRAEAETIAAEGWKWIEAAPSFPYAHDHGLRRLEGEPADLTAEEQASLDALQAEYTALQEKYEDADEMPDEVDTRLGEIEEALAAFDDRPHMFDAAAIAHAGVFVSIDADGTLHVERGYVRREDEPAFVAASAEPNSEVGAAGSDAGDRRAPAVQGSVISMAGQAPPDEEEDDAIRPLPDRLVMELTAHRTLALQDAVAARPHVAMTALLYKLCVDAFHRTYGPGCLEAGVRHVQLSVQAPELKESASAKSIAARHDAWKADVPADEAALWDWLVVLDDASRLALLAHCISFGVNALFEKVDRHGGPGITAHGLQRRLDQADRLARAVDLDMVEAGWRPTVDNYLGRVTKGRILDAVREAKGESSAQLIDHLKKSEMAKEAERLLEGAGWLPDTLRVAAVASPSDSSDVPSEPLPDFLSKGGDEESTDGGESEQPHAVAAE